MFSPSCQICHITLYETKMSQSILLHIRMLHTSSYTSTYGKITHQSELIQKYIPSSHIISPLGQIIINPMKDKFQIPMSAYMLDVLYFHQSNILFLLFAHDFGYSIELFSVVKNSQDLPQLLHIASRDFLSCLLIITTLLSSITKLTKTGEC